MKIRKCESSPCSMFRSLEWPLVVKGTRVSVEVLRQSHTYKIIFKPLIFVLKF